jgi:hypothetical protein
MEKHGLRGLLLGVSLALLLSGGVALAQGMSITFDQECFECWPGPGEPTEEYILVVTLTGWDPAHDVYAEVSVDGLIIDACGPCVWVGADPKVISLSVPCEGGMGGTQAGFGGELSIADSIESYYGEWTWRMWQPDTGESVRATNLFAADCAAAMFVPEPGSVLLLGSGLAGLAGYAVLRRRGRE